MYSRGVSKSTASSLDSLCRLQNVCLRPSCSGSQRVTHHAANFMSLYIHVGLLCHGMYAAVMKRRQPRLRRLSPEERYENARASVKTWRRSKPERVRAYIEAWKRRNYECYLQKIRELNGRPEYLAVRRALYAKKRRAALEDESNKISPRNQNKLQCQDSIQTTSLK